MASSQNKVLKLYGPWKGVADSDGDNDKGKFEIGFNVERDGDELTLRGGVVPFSHLHTAVTTPRRLHALPSGNLCVTGNLAVTLDYGDRYATLTSDADFANGGAWGSVRVGPFIYTLDDQGRIVVVDEYGKTANLMVPTAGLQTTRTYRSALPAFCALEAYNERLFGVTFDGTVLYSDVFYDPTNVNPESTYGGVQQWPVEAEFVLGPTTAQYGLKVSGGYLACFSSTRVALFDENSLQDVPTAAGCIAPESIARSPKGVIYLAPDGVRLLVGAQSVLISDGVSEAIRQNIPNGGYSPCTGVCVPSKHQYRLFVPVRESLQPQIALVWDYESNDWFVWGIQAPWETQTGNYAVTSAVVLPSVGGDERLLTTAPGRVTFIHDVGDVDCVDDTSPSTPIRWAIAFKPIGFGEDQGVAVWRDVRIEAKSHATDIRCSVLIDGEKFEEGQGSTSTATVSYPYVLTKLDTQSVWNDLAPADAPLYTGSATASVPRWTSWRIGTGKVGRTCQVVLYNGWYDNTATATPGIFSIRGVEVEARDRRGRR